MRAEAVGVSLMRGIKACFFRFITMRYESMQ
jgi:hypothetical protein